MLRPSDNVGVTFTKLDDAGAWKTELAREMTVAGIAIHPGALLGLSSGSLPGDVIVQSGNDKDEPVDTEYIDLNEAALRAYEETEESIVARFAEMPVRDDDRGVVSWYAYAIIGKDADLPLYGRKPPSRIHRRIPAEEIRRCRFSDDAGSLIPHGKNQPKFTDLRIKGLDFEERLAEIKSWGTDNAQD